MSCCGQNRDTLKQTSTVPTQAWTTAPAYVNGASAGDTRVRYMGGDHVLVRGPRTGWQYEFFPQAPVQAVEPRDAEWLVATGRFVRAD